MFRAFIISIITVVNLIIPEPFQLTAYIITALFLLLIIVNLIKLIIKIMLIELTKYLFIQFM
jgi:hypothetical protein